MALHSALTGDEALHQICDHSESEPTLDPGKCWLKESTGVAKIRNEADDGWITVGDPTGLATHLADGTDAHDASAISYAGATGMAATDVETAIDEVKGELDDHTADATDAHDASAISYDGGTGMAATNVEDAIDELATEKADASALTAHTGDTSDAHDASAISLAAIAGITATDVQAGIEELKDEIDAIPGGSSAPFTDADPLVMDNADNTKLLRVDVGNIATGTTRVLTMPNTNVSLADIATNTTAISDHISDATDAHDASAISLSAITGVAATDVQAALAEHQTDIDSLSAGTALNPTTTAEYFDDFISGQNNGNTGTLGALGWHGGNGTNPGGIAAEPGHPGILQKGTGTSSGTTAMVRLSGNGTTMDVFTFGETFDQRWGIRLGQNDANTQVQIGMFSAGTALNETGFYFERLAADTNWFIASSDGSKTRTDTGVASSTNWVSLRIRRKDASTIGFTINGGTEIDKTTNLPPDSTSCTAGVIINNTAAANKTIDIDYFWMRITGLNR